MWADLVAHLSADLCGAARVRLATLCERGAERWYYALSRVAESVDDAGFAGHEWLTSLAARIRGEVQS